MLKKLCFSLKEKDSHQAYDTFWYIYQYSALLHSIFWASVFWITCIFLSKSNQFLMTLIGLPLILLKSQQLIIIIIMSLAYESVKYLEGSFFKNVVDKNEPFFLVECDEYSQLSSWNSHCWRQGHTFYWQLSFEVSRGSKSGNRKTMKQNI